ncbi:hypothetical protein QAD02_022572 [Eretmocerus hayati]|uniref:Uncharacterized protein n=1 Tax=Eretmocerus hayati TaxID=131215 RepID=A0ACC2PUH8_9HYME|nr:hypothetical protein QAD02_022572 [Eretmocerus hayati]
MNDSDEDSHDAIRERNIAERNAFLKEFLQNIQQDTEEINKLESARLKIWEKENETPKSPKPTRKRRRSQIDGSSSFKGQNIHLQFRKKYNTRSRKRKLDDTGNSDNTESDEELASDKDIVVPKNGSNIKVMFSWARPMQRDIDLMKFDFKDDENDDSNSDSEIFELPKKRVQRMSRSTYDPNNIPSPDEITDRMLKNIASKLSGKVYDAINGTSCHQCRQKTKDTKTVCRSGECVGVRGQFCGPCLLMRYGESAVEALKDPDWACPPCRGLCNCSICRTRNGQRPTGILAPTAKEEGYDSVKDYLQALDGED